MTTEHQTTEEMLPCWLCGDTELDGGCYPCGLVYPENKGREWWRCTCGNPECYARTGIEGPTRAEAIAAWNRHPYRQLAKRVKEYEAWERNINEALNSGDGSYRP